MDLTNVQEVKTSSMYVDKYAKMGDNLQFTH